MDSRERMANLVAVSKESGALSKQEDVNGGKGASMKRLSTQTTEGCLDITPSKDIE